MIRTLDLLILGGGYGTRLFKDLNLTEYVPKGLIKIDEYSGLDYSLNTFSRDFINKVIIETNNEGKKPYSNWIKNNKSKYDLKLFVEPFSSPNSCLGVLDTLEYTNNILRFENPILILAPDNLFLENQDQLILNQNQSDAKILTYELENLHDAKKYGVLNVQDSKIIKCEEKPNNPKSKLIRTVYEIWTPKMFQELRAWNRKGNSDKVGDYINYLIEKDFEIVSVPAKGKWIDIGTKKDLMEARNKLK